MIDLESARHVVVLIAFLTFGGGVLLHQWLTGALDFYKTFPREEHEL